MILFVVLKVIKYKLAVERKWNVVATGTLMKCWVFHCFAMDSQELSSISDCFGDKKVIKTPKLDKIWLELIARILNMLIGLKGDNYYSKVFKKVNYKLWNNTFWVVITPPNQHIASPLAMKERKIKIKSIIIYNIMLIKKQFPSGMMI